MRQIKFRGKRICQDNWVYGYYFYEASTNRHFIQQEDGIALIVDKNTVGQFIGRLDKDSVEIYEGDILENINMKYKEHKNAVVEWAGHRYILRCLCGVVFNHGFENISISEIKVIGNIYTGEAK